MSDVDRFLERFRAFGAAPSVERYLPLFDPEATLFDSGMARAIRVGRDPRALQRRSVDGAGFPDGRPQRWRQAGSTVFVEAHNQATLAGVPLEWPAVYCVDLRADRVIRGRRYYDRQPLFARIDPNTPTLGMSLTAALPNAERKDGTERGRRYPPFRRVAASHRNSAVSRSYSAASIGSTRAAPGPTLIL